MAQIPYAMVLLSYQLLRKVAVEEDAARRKAPFEQRNAGGGMVHDDQVGAEVAAPETVHHGQRGVLTVPVARVERDVREHRGANYF